MQWFKLQRCLLDPMANPDQKTILIEQTYKDIKEICKEFQLNSGSSDLEVIALLKEIANFWKTEEKNKKFWI